MSDLIGAGDVRVNWKGCDKGAMVLKAGDVVTVRGKGRVVLTEVATTKKDRYAVTLSRFV